MGSAIVRADRSDFGLSGEAYASGDSRGAIHPVPVEETSWTVHKLREE